MLEPSVPARWLVKIVIDGPLGVVGGERAVPKSRSFDENVGGITISP